ncbi:MAG: FHA domain-containing protein [Desulfocucumaceae bacterium]
MLDLILTVLRYLFLAVLYIFIFQLIKMMVRDLGSGEPAVDSGVKKTPGVMTVEPARIEALPPPGAEAGLVVLSSGDPGLPPGSVFAMKNEEEATLGRNSRNAITMVDPFASMEHASVYGRGGQFWISDRGSRNGTFLNEVRISKPTVLADGDRIRIGGVILQFVRWTYEVESGDRSGSGQETK